MCLSCNMVEKTTQKYSYGAKKVIAIFVDNVSAIALAKNPVFHERSKYIDVQYHFIRDRLKRMKLKSCM